MENYDAPTQVKREAERDSTVHLKSLVPMPTPHGVPRQRQAGVHHWAGPDRRL